MFGLIVSIVLLAASVILMVGMIIINRIDPSYGSCLAVPVFNGLAFILALLGTVVSVVAYQNNKGMKLAKCTMVVGFACTFILLLLFPLSNRGLLSVCY